MPYEVEMVLREFRTCELSTLARDGTPITWPVGAFSKPPETEHFLFSTSIGLPQKAFNIRRNPKVSILFSEPMGSDLMDPPYVLVQGLAEAPDRIETSFPVYGDENIWKLRPHRFTPGLEIGNFYLSFLQMIHNGRRTAKRYLDRRGLPRPEIPWDEIREIYT